ncbi:MAG: FxsA family protein [Pseudomonadota bacterium]
MSLIFLLFPLLELYTLIALGSAYGALTAIAWVVLGIFLGMSMIRRQGLSMIRQLQQDAETGLISARMLGDDLAVVTSGLLLIVPGLVTDIMAALVLIGPLRRRLAGIGSTERVTVSDTYRAQDSSPGRAQPDPGARDASIRDHNVTLEGDYRRLDD